MSPLILCSIVACLRPPVLLLDTATTLTRVVNLHIGPNEVIYLLNNQTTVDIRPLIVQLNRSVFVSNGQHQVTHIDADLWYSPNTLNAFVVALCEELWPCFRLIADQIKRHAFNPRRKVLMQLVKDIPGSSSEILSEVFRRCWEINLSNVVIQIGGCCSPTASHQPLQSFTFNPYDPTFLINLTER